MPRIKKQGDYADENVHIDIIKKIRLAQYEVISVIEIGLSGKTIYYCSTEFVTRVERVRYFEYLCSTNQYH